MTKAIVGVCGMNNDNRTIRKLIGFLSDAFWRRATQPGVSWIDCLREEKYRPESVEENAIWDELTAPHNYSALRHFMESLNKEEMTEYAVKLYELILSEATSRLEKLYPSRPVQQP